MKKILLIVSSIICLTSCFSTKHSLVVPRAVNTVNSVGLKELNLERGDYKILNTVTASATITYTENKSGTEYSIAGENNEFMLLYRFNEKKGWECRYSGIVKLGFLSNDYQVGDIGILQPEEVARRLAIYRLVNQVHMDGGDGVIEPIISTNVAQRGKNVIYKATVSAKIVKLNSDN